MFRFLSCVAIAAAFTVAAVLVAPEAAPAQYFNKGFNDGFSGSNFPQSKAEYYHQPGYGSSYPSYSVPSGTPVYVQTPGQEASSVARTGKRAFVTIHAPDNATVWFAGVRANKKGPDHKFRTMPLSTHEPTRFSVEARWTTKDGEQADLTKTVTVRGGQHAEVNFGGKGGLAP